MRRPSQNVHLGRLLLSAACLTSALVAACSWDPSRPFDRESPDVRDAIRSLDAGDASFAATTLENYLSTGACSEGSIGAPATILEKANGAFDLGLSLFKIGESFGERFGDEEVDAGSPEAQQRRSAQVECALRLTRSVANDLTQPVALRARARYLEGNLLFLERSYEDAVHAYDAAIELVPGVQMHDGGEAGVVDATDSTGRDAAWNRAIALRRIEDKKDAGNDGGGDGGGDGGSGDASSDSGQNNDSGGDSGGGGNDAGKDGGSSQPDAGGDGGSPPPQQPDAGQQQQQQPPPRASQDERMLDSLENAPTMQQEEAKRQAAKRHVVRGMDDK